MSFSLDLITLSGSFKSLEEFNIERSLYDEKTKKIINLDLDLLLCVNPVRVISKGFAKWRIQKDYSLIPMMEETRKVTQNILHNLDNLDIYASREISSELTNLYNQIEVLKEKNILINAFNSSPGIFNKDKESLPQFVDSFFLDVSESVLTALVSVKEHISELEFEIFEALPITTNQAYKYCLGKEFKKNQNLIKQFIRDNEAFPRISIKNYDNSLEEEILNLKQFQIAGMEIVFRSFADAEKQLAFVSNIGKKIIVKNLLPQKVQSLLKDDYDLIRKVVVLMTQGAEYDTFNYLTTHELDEGLKIKSSSTLDFNNRIIFEVRKEGEILLKINRTYVFACPNALEEEKKIQTTTVFNLTNLDEKVRLIIH